MEREGGHSIVTLSSSLRLRVDGGYDEEISRTARLALIDLVNNRRELPAARGPDWWSTWRGDDGLMTDTDELIMLHAPAVP